MTEKIVSKPLVPAVLPSQYYLEKTDWLKQQGNWRTRVITDKVVSPLEADGNHLLIHREGQTLINFSGNDYLGLSQDNRLKQAAIEAIQNYGTGSGSARLISGHTELTHQLEKTIAGWKQTESALVFNSGYQTNVGILQAILKPGDWVFCDRLNHASLVDGCLLSGARWSRYRHLDLHHLDQLLGKAPQQVLKWIVTDSVFSMDGDYPDLKKLVEIAKKHHALIMLDEAHATGLFGNQRSSGLAEQFGVCNDIALQVGTFSKALGGSGGFVAGSSLLIEWLVNHARGFIYSTALPPSVIASALQAIQIVQEDAGHKKDNRQTGLTQALWHNITLFERLIQGHAKQGHVIAQHLEKQLAFPLKSPIIPIILGSNETAMAVRNALLTKGFFVQAIRPPTVPSGTARLRLSLSAVHTENMVTQLVEALLAVLADTGWQHEKGHA